jgi:hypothetical protein
LISINKRCRKPGKPVLFAWGTWVPHSIKGYEDRAQECVRLANAASDQMVSAELLKLRQTYLNIAERLRSQGVTPPEKPA